MKRSDTIEAQAHILVNTVKLLRQRFFVNQMNAGRDIRVERNQFTEAQLGTMLTLREEGTMSLKQLAESLGVSSPSASVMVDRLVEAGMVDRQPNKSDRREVRIALTSDGRAAADEYQQAFLDSAADLLEKVGTDWAEQWCAVYRRVQEVLETERAEQYASAGLEGDRIQ